MKEDGLDPFGKNTTKCCSLSDRHQQQRGAGPLHHHHSSEAEYRRGPHLFFPCGHRTHYPPVPAFLHWAGTGRRRQAADLRDFFKGNEPAAFAFDLKEHMKKGHSFKDWLCPDSMEFQKDHFRLNDRWGRVLLPAGLRFLHQRIP